MGSIRAIMSECTQTGKNIQILLSTFNGEKYLKEQLNSFFKMEGFEFCKVLIRDDGSTDKTKDILKQYEKQNQFEIVYGENIGITNSYLWLMEHSDASCEYFAMSDQDDIWLPNKIMDAVSKICQYNSEKPILLATRSHIVDANLKPIADSPIPKRGISFYNAMVQNVLPGHTQVMNRTLLQLITRRGLSDVHVIDWWFYLVASALGNVIFLPEFTVLHRQHGDNAVGMQTSMVRTFIRRINYIRDGRGNAFSKQLNAFYHLYKEDLPDEYAQETLAFLNSLPNIGQRVLYMLKTKAYRQTVSDSFMFRILYILGKYKL